MPPCSLAQLPLGHSARITSLTAAAAPFRRKLLAMGIIPGQEVTAVRLAPLGDPLEIRIRGFKLCLRLSEAATIMVQPETAS
ncbi:ferrous iron transport protein A [Neisseriaceae bacterium CLB008]